MRLSHDILDGILNLVVNLYRVPHFKPTMEFLVEVLPGQNPSLSPLEYFVRDFFDYLSGPAVSAVRFCRRSIVQFVIVLTIVFVF